MQEWCILTVYTSCIGIRQLLMRHTVVVLTSLRVTPVSYIVSVLLDWKDQCSTEAIPL